MILLVSILKVYMRNEKIYLVRNVKNGGTYRIGESKLKKEPGEWETILEKKSNVEEIDLNVGIIIGLQFFNSF